MELITDTILKNNLSETLDRVNIDHIPLIVTRENRKLSILNLKDVKS